MLTYAIYRSLQTISIDREMSLFPLIAHIVVAVVVYRQKLSVLNDPKIVISILRYSA